MTVGLKRDVNTALDANGAGTNQIVNNNAGTLWIIRQISMVTNPRTSGATCELTPPTGIVDTSYFAGTGDAARGEYYLYSGDFLKMSWSRGPANGVGLATVYYDEILQ